MGTAQDGRRAVGLFHFNIVCSNFERSYHFYVDVLGFKPALKRLAPSHLQVGPMPGEFNDSPTDSQSEYDLLDFRGNGVHRAAFLYLDHEQGPYLDLLWFEQPGGVVQRQANDVGLARVCFWSDDIDVDAARIAAAGAPIVLPLCDITVAGRPYRCVVFRDPDGVMLEYLAESQASWA